PAVLLEVAGEVRLIWPTTLVPVVDVVVVGVDPVVGVDAVVGVVAAAVAVCLALLSEPPLETRMITTTTITNAASPSSSAPPRRELRRDPPGSGAGRPKPLPASLVRSSRSVRVIRLAAVSGGPLTGSGAGSRRVAS